MVFSRAIYCNLSEACDFGPHLHPMFLWYSFSKQSIFIPHHRSPIILSLNLPDKILCFMFKTQTYITCPVHFIRLNFKFDNNFWLNTKYFEINYAYSATSYYYPPPPSVALRSKYSTRHLPVIHSQNKDHGLRTYKTKPAYGILKWKVSRASLVQKEL